MTEKKLSSQQQFALSRLIVGDIDDMDKVRAGIRSHTLTSLITCGYVVQYASAYASYGRRWKITDAGRERVASGWVAVQFHGDAI